jgi:hypothetical protein
MTEELTSKSDFTIRITKRTGSASIFDVKKIIEEYEKTEDEAFWYVYFSEGNKDFEQVFAYVSGWKTTKLWVKGEEFPLEYHTRRNFQDTIFCKYKEKCDGSCLHNLDLNLNEHNWSDPFYKDKEAENESVQGLKKWFDNFETLQKTDNWRFGNTLAHMIDYNILVKETADKLKLNKDLLKKHIQKKLEFELKYCPQISFAKTIEDISRFPVFLEISKRTQGLLKEDSTDDITYDNLKDSDDDEIDYEKRLAGFIGDEVEKRLRKVLSEFFETKK